ncbi:MAG: acyltransferase family protein [Chloroflexota bacterium]|nr:acyltransferase family protein [Chloroflexota bacterium]
MVSMSTNLDTHERYHGLDGLRGFAMLLGILLHGSLPYFSRMLEIESMWPADDEQSLSLLLLFDFIHVWRMPTFFLLAGFFAHLLLERRTTKEFIVNRLKRIAVPLVIFGSIMALLLPVIWIYGWKGSISIETMLSSFDKGLELDSSGGLVGHLWFLYYLIIIYIGLILFRFLAAFKRALVTISATWMGFVVLMAYINGLGPFPGVSLFMAFGLAIIGIITAMSVTILALSASTLSLVGRTSLGEWAAKLIYSRVPILLISGAVILLTVRGVDESKPIWPLNMPDLFYFSIFFIYGYGLWSNKHLIEKLKSSATLVTLLIMSAAVYYAHLVSAGILEELRASGKTEIISLFETVNILAYGSAAVLITLGIVGMFEATIRGPVKWVRWLGDSSYWIYIIHLPLVAFLSFWVAHLDRDGWLRALTGLNWTAEMKFTIVCLLTAALGIITYRYLVRYTPIGWFLNGRRDG